jgi:hypothetical protein
VDEMRPRYVLSGGENSAIFGLLDEALCGRDADGWSRPITVRFQYEDVYLDGESIVEVRASVDPGPVV